MKSLRQQMRQFTVILMTSLLVFALLAYRMVLPHTHAWFTAGVSAGPAQFQAGFAPVTLNPSIDGVPHVGELVTVSGTYFDAEADPGKVLAEWFRSSDGSEWVSAGSQSTPPLSSGHSFSLTRQLPPEEAQHYIKARLTPLADTGFLKGASVDLLLTGRVNSAPEITYLQIIGNAVEGQTLRVDYSYFDADGDPEDTHDYEWWRVGGASFISTSPTYTLTANDVGQSILVKVTPRAQSGLSPGAQVASGSVGPVQAYVPPADQPPGSPANYSPGGASYSVNQEQDLIRFTVTGIHQNHHPLPSSVASLYFRGDSKSGSFQETGSQGNRKHFEFSFSLNEIVALLSPQAAGTVYVTWNRSTTSGFYVAFEVDLTSHLAQQTDSLYSPVADQSGPKPTQPDEDDDERFGPEDPEDPVDPGSEGATDGNEGGEEVLPPGSGKEDEEPVPPPDDTVDPEDPNDQTGGHDTENPEDPSDDGDDTTDPDEETSDPDTDNG
jgi:hypothetical protein